MEHVSVIVPTFNRVDLLSRTLESVCWQREVDLEIIVINGASSDRTAAWLDRRAEIDPRIRPIHHDRSSGVSHVRNQGIAVAKNRWIAFCDDDDLWAPNKLAVQLNALRSSSHRWACTAAVIIDEQDQVIGRRIANGGEVFLDLLGCNPITTSSVLVDAELLEKAGVFDPGLSVGEDWDLWLRLAQLSPLTAIDRPFVAYRQFPGSLSTHVAALKEAQSRILARYSHAAPGKGALAGNQNHERFIAKQLLRAGSGREAAAIYARLAIRHLQWRDIPRIAAALIAPELANLIGTAMGKAAVPAEWTFEASEWLTRIGEKREDGKLASAT